MREVLSYTFTGVEATVCHYGVYSVGRVPWRPRCPKDQHASVNVCVYAVHKSVLRHDHKSNFNTATQL